jgi:hypothetical protein
MVVNFAVDIAYAAADPSIAQAADMTNASILPEDGAWASFSAL